MAKNPKTEVVPAGESRWLDSLDAVRDKYRSAMEAATTASRLILDFAQSYARAHAEADELPGSKQQRRDRKMKLHQKIGIDNKSESWRSNIRAIGESAPWMRRHAKHLPNSTDSLTLIAKNSEFAVTRLIDKGLLDEQSTINETRAALGAPNKVAASYRQTYDATWSFKNKADAVDFFVRGLRQSTGTLTTSDKALRAAITQALGKSDADKFRKRLV